MVFNKNNLNVHKLVSKDEHKPFSGVFFGKDKTVATDTFSLVEVSTVADANIKEYPTVQGKYAMHGFKPFIVESSALKNIKLPKHKDSDPLADTFVVSHRDKTHVELMAPDMNTVITGSRKSGQYPEYEQLFAKGEPDAEIKVSAKRLQKLLSIMEGVSDHVTIKVHGDKVELGCSSSNQYARGLLMKIT